MSTGFVIVNQHEEFLADVIHQPGAVFFSWAKTPILAKVFPTRKKCEKSLRLIDKRKYELSILNFSETDTQIFLSGHWPGNRAT